MYVDFISLMNVSTRLRHISVEMWRWCNGHRVKRLIKRSIGEMLVSACSLHQVLSLLLFPHTSNFPLPCLSQPRCINGYQLTVKASKLNGTSNVRTCKGFMLQTPALMATSPKLTLPLLSAFSSCCFPYSRRLPM